MTIHALTESKVNSIKLYTSSDGSSWTEAGTYTKATGEQTVTLATPTANLYYKLEFDCASGSENGLVTVSKVEYYYYEGTPTVATPVISPNGGNFNNSQEVAITCATQGATIYYTTDGSTPTTSSTVYSAPFTLNATTTVKAFAVATGYDDSQVAVATFTLVPQYTLEVTSVSNAEIFVFDATDLDDTNWVNLFEGVGNEQVNEGTRIALSVSAAEVGAQPSPGFDEVAQFSINISKNRGSHIDRAIVRFDNGGLLPQIPTQPEQYEGLHHRG